MGEPVINQLGPKLPINASGSGIGTSPDDRQVFPQVIEGRKGAGASDAWEAGTTSRGAVDVPMPSIGVADLTVNAFQVMPAAGIRAVVLRSRA